MGVLADAGVFGPQLAPTPNGNGQTMSAATSGGFNLSAGTSGTAVAMLVAMGLLALVYWRTAGLQH